MWLHDAQRIRKTDAVSSGLDGGVAYTHKKFKFGARGVFRRITHFQVETTSIRDMLADDCNGFIGGLMQLRIEMDLGGGIKDGNAIRTASFRAVNAGARGNGMGDDL